MGAEARLCSTSTAPLRYSAFLPLARENQGLLRPEFERKNKSAFD